MKQGFDIREYKKKLREKYKATRKNMDPEKKRQKDRKIFDRIISLPEYRHSSTLLTFVSTDIEVDTHALINHSLAHGKTVAVPYCVDGTRQMQFYCINSMSQLVRRTFGVLEPVAEECEQLTDFSNSVCILPGLSFDNQGYRLGYGGGYYDRFLSKVYTGTTVGICYSECTRPHLIHGRFDVPCDLLVTDRNLRKINKRPDIKKKKPHK